jgi:formamidopyrimidine-DNA glycosylase
MSGDITVPELPEVETVKRAISPVLTGQSIKSVRLTRSDLRWALPNAMAAHLTGKRCGEPRRRAKYIMVPLEDNTALLVHLGMSGAIRLHDSKPEFGAHDHFSLEMETGMWMVYSDPRRFGHLDIIPAGGEAEHPLLSHLGIEPLSNHLSGPWLSEVLEGKKTLIKSALLDQRLIAGLGNIYVNEALHMSGISPRRRAQTITGKRAEKLVIAIRTVLAAAIEAGGTSLRDHVQPGGEIGYFVQRLLVYGRTSEPCLNCATPIKELRQSGRASFYCPSCQR